MDTIAGYFCCRERSRRRRIERHACCREGEKKQQFKSISEDVADLKEIKAAADLEGMGLVDCLHECISNSMVHLSKTGS